MTENRFLSFVLTESILLLCLGLGMLILPKVTIISFGFMMCLSFVAFGGFKIISTILTKNFSKHFILDIFTGLILLTNGIILFAAPMLDIMWVIGLSGIYFILKSLSSSSFMVQTRKTLNFWWMCLFLAVLELLLGFVTIVLLPSAALWLIGVLIGTDFILSGFIYMNMYIATKYLQNI